MLIFDRIDLSQSKRKTTTEGYLSVPANLARIGTYDYKAGDIGMTDRDPSTPVKVYRPADEVFNADSMASFSLKPVTDGHPPEMVNIKNIKKYQVGHAASQIDRNGEFMMTDLLITDEEVISAIENGKVEVSNGYTADFDFVRGETEAGEKYDAVQRNIRGNHIAIVDKARGGRGCRLSDEEKQENSMKKIMFDGMTIEVTEQGEQAISKLQSDNKELKDGAITAQSEAQTKQAEAQATIDGLEQKVKDAEAKVLDGEALDAMIETRAQLITDAKSLVKDYDPKGKTDGQIREEVVVAVCDGVSLDGMEPEYKAVYVKARFDGALAVLDSKDDGSGNVKIDDKEDDMPDSEKKREEFKKATEDQYKVKEGAK